MTAIEELKRSLNMANWPPERRLKAEMRWHVDTFLIMARTHKQDRLPPEMLAPLSRASLALNWSGLFPTPISLSTIPV